MALSIEDLVAYFRAGEKPKQDWRIGVEHEKFLYHKATLRPLTYETTASADGARWGIGDLLRAFAAAHPEWNTVYDGDHAVALIHPENRSITLEPGGQVELSGAPLRTVDACCAETTHHHRLLKDLLASEDVGMLATGMLPLWRIEDMPWMPKSRYTLMREAMHAAAARGDGDLGTSMMTRTATVQCNLDYGSEQDMINKMRVAVAVQPFVTMIFANSSVASGELSAYQSHRRHIWEHTDRQRTGMPMFVFDEDFGYESWASYVASVPMYFRTVDGAKIPVTGNFHDLMAGRLVAAVPTEHSVNAEPSLDDWEDQITFAFPEVRLKRYIEMRGADSGPWSVLCSLPAFWTGILYDEAVLADAVALIMAQPTSTWEEAATLSATGELSATSVKLAGRTVLEWCNEFVALAARGLEARFLSGATMGVDERSFLSPLHALLESGRTGAFVMQENYRALDLTASSMAGWDTFYARHSH
ncbi:MAG: glutamate--cysteine ligase [Alphaproteobacteria bacterium]|nr:glutamate--cysteine ligase [Alphaproteobacteria bacterium]